MSSNSKSLPTKESIIRELKDLVGDVETPEQVIRASEWLDSIRCDELSILKDEAWMDYVNLANKRFYRIWDELSFYRIIGTPAGLIVPGWVSSDRAFDELCLLGERWALLSSEDELWELEFYEEIQEVKLKGGSLGQRLKAYLDIPKKRAGFEEWTEEHMSDARYRVIEVHKAYVDKKQRSMALLDIDKHKIDTPASQRIPQDSAALHQIFGKIKSSEEIAKAAKYSDPMANGDRGQAQKAAFKKYVRENCNLARVSSELQMWRWIGQSSIYFISEQDMGITIFRELGFVVRDWVILEARGSPNVLVEVGLAGDSTAARLKSYMGIYKAQKKIEKWTEQNLNCMRFSICQALTESAKQNSQIESKSEVAESPSNPLKRFGDGDINVPLNMNKRPRDDATTPASMPTNLGRPRSTPLIQSKIRGHLTSIPACRKTLCNEKNDGYLDFNPC